MRRVPAAESAGSSVCARLIELNHYVCFLTFVAPHCQQLREGVKIPSSFDKCHANRAHSPQNLIHRDIQNWCRRRCMRRWWCRRESTQTWQKGCRHVCGVLATWHSCVALSYIKITFVCAVYLQNKLSNYQAARRKNILRALIVAKFSNDELHSYK